MRQRYGAKSLGSLAQIRDPMFEIGLVLACVHAQQCRRVQRDEHAQQWDLTTRAR